MRRLQIVSHLQSGFDERLDSLRADVIVLIDDVECKRCRSKSPVTSKP